MPAQIIWGDIRSIEPSSFQTALQTAKINRIDTAARYCNGESEKAIGRSNIPQNFTIDTKIWTESPSDGTLTPEAIEKSLTNSLAILGVEKVHVLYVHAPDHKTPIEIQARAFDEQYRKGRFEYLGVSNIPLSMLQSWHKISTSENLIKPLVYEGQYNLFCRGYETHLFPFLRENNMYFTAYSPLAGGFLRGNFTSSRTVKDGTRFADSNGPFNKWYDKPGMHDAMDKLKDLSQRSGVPTDELSVRWLMHHSALTAEDGVIFGASKVGQIAGSVEMARKGPLEDGVVKEIDALWEICGENGRSIVDGF